MKYWPMNAATELLRMFARSVLARTSNVSP
jgi:hypothetical protein